MSIWVRAQNAFWKLLGFGHWNKTWARVNQQIGKLNERDRIVALLEHRRDHECGFGVTHDLIALIKGENE